jgi:hypothetical protein
MRGVRQIMFAVVLGGSLVAACGATAEQLTRRASFDLNCPEHNLRYHAIDDRTQGVVGCGKRATYISTCDRTRDGWEANCTWVINGSIQGSAGDSAGRSLPPPPGPPPPAPPPEPPRPQQ